MTKGFIWTVFIANSHTFLKGIRWMNIFQVMMTMKIIRTMMIQMMTMILAQRVVVVVIALGVNF
jgi:hypothetical protein